MVSYKLVREVRTGRQSIEELIHLIDDETGETLCNNFESSEVRPVRTLGVYKGDSPMCEKCSKKSEIDI